MWSRKYFFPKLWRVIRCRCHLCGNRGFVKYDFYSRVLWLSEKFLCRECTKAIASKYPDEDINNLMEQLYGNSQRGGITYAFNIETANTTDGIL